MQNTWSEHLSAKGPGTFRTVCVASSMSHQVRAALESQRIKLYFLDASVIDSKHLLLLELLKSFGVYGDALLAESLSWDVVSDDIWQVLMERPDNQVAILINRSDAMIANHLQLFLDFLELLFALGDTLEQQELTADCHPVLLRIVAFGEGSSFPQWQ